jgi:hypothetical protein
MCDVAFWHEAEMPKYLGNVRYWLNSGKHLLPASISGFDPTVWTGRALQAEFE